MEKHGKIASILIVSALLLSLFAPLAQAAEQPMPGTTERAGPVGLEMSVSEFDQRDQGGLALSVSEGPRQPYELTLTPDTQQATVGTEVDLTVVVTDAGVPAEDTRVNCAPTLGIVVSPITTTGGTAVTTLSGITDTVTATVLCWVAGVFPLVQDTAEVGFTPGLAAQFVFSPVSTQTAGVDFTINITAEDEYGNTATDWVLGVNLTDTTETIRPLRSGAFVDGVLTGQQVTITQVLTDVTITASRLARTGTSDPFDVGPGPVALFTFDHIDDQIATIPFALTITAEDAHGNTATQWTGPGSWVNLTDSTGTIQTPSGNFSEGVWSGFRSISQAQTNVVITATKGVTEGYSNAFDVAPNVPDITIDKSVDAEPFYPGDVRTYQVVLENQGIADATGVQMDDGIPDNTTYVADSLTWEGGGTATWYPDPANTVIWDGDIDSGARVTVTFQVTIAGEIDDDTLITNTASVTESHLAGRREDEVVTTVSSRLDPGPLVADPVPGSDVNPSSSIVYSIAVANVSESDVPEAQMLDVLDPNTTFVTGTVTNQAGSIEFLSGDGNLQWTGVVTANETITFSIQADVNADVQMPLVIANNLMISDDAGNDFGRDVTHTVVSMLEASKSVETERGGGVAYPGDLLFYTLVLEATSGDVDSVTVVDPIPDNTSYVAHGGGAYLGGTVT